MPPLQSRCLIRQLCRLCNECDRSLYPLIASCLGELGAIDTKSISFYVPTLPRTGEAGAWSLQGTRQAIVILLKERLRDLSEEVQFSSAECLRLLLSPQKGQMTLAVMPWDTQLDCILHIFSTFTHPSSPFSVPDFPRTPTFPKTRVLSSTQATQLSLPSPAFQRSPLSFRRVNTLSFVVVWGAP